jgi:hypothetical protein
MRFRKLRIAWSVALGILAVLLIVLWVRSYQTFDRVSGRLAGRTSAICVSYAGGLSTVFTRPGTLRWNWPRRDSGPILANKVTMAELDLSRFTYADTDVVWPQHTRMGFGWIYRNMYMNIPNSATGWNPQGLTGRSWATGATGLLVPHWFGVLILATLAGVPWIRWKWRFSLRTLLITTTLVAALLGLIVYAVRS